MLTGRGGGVIGAALALWLGSRAFGVPELQVAAVAALLLTATALVLVRATGTRLEVERVVRPATLAHGGAGSVELVVTNRGWLPTLPMLLVDARPSALGDPARHPLPLLWPGQRHHATAPVTGARRGHWQLGPATVRRRDPFGLAEHRRTLPGTRDLVVHPPVRTLANGLPLGGSSTSSTRGARRRRAGGDDLAGVREYVQGDDLRAVHWASTAHRGKLMVRQSETTEEPRAVLALDLRASRHRGRGERASIEPLVEAAASIVNHLTARRRSVVVVDAPLTAPPTSPGWEPLLDHLAAVQPHEVDVPAMLGQIGQGVAGDGALVVVLPTPTADDLQRLVRAGRGFATRAALMIDAAGAEGEPGPDAERTADALRTAGWRATVLRPGEDLGERWRDLVVQRRGRRTLGTVA